MTLVTKIHQYKALKGMRSQLDTRIQELRKDILSELGDEPQGGLCKQVRKTVTYDPDKLMDIILEQRLPTRLALTKVVINESGVEEAYLNGELTDQDLRDIRIVKSIEALVEVEDVS